MRTICVMRMLREIVGVIRLAADTAYLVLLPIDAIVAGEGGTLDTHAPISIGARNGLPRGRPPTLVQESNEVGARGQVMKPPGSIAFSSDCACTCLCGAERTRPP